jgi:glutaredoxin-related protein
MTPTEYIATFELKHPGYSSYPINYQHYIPLNKSRFTRSLKQGVITQELTEVIRAINEKQDWIIITEPWCGDAAQIVPYLFKMAALNPLINVLVQLRDSHSEIDSYLSNGKMSIPKLIVRNKEGIDLFTWGPQPKALESLIINLNKDNHSKEVIKVSEQKWYNDDKGRGLQDEIIELIKVRCFPL